MSSPASLLLRVASVRALCCLCVLAALSGCTAGRLAKRYVRDYGCPRSQPSVRKSGPLTYRVNGCAGEVNYTCRRNLSGGPGDLTCRADRAPKKRERYVSNAAREASMEGASARRGASGQTRWGSVWVQKADAGLVVVAVDVLFDATTRLSLRAIPARHPDIVQVELTQPRARGRKFANCDIDWMINGQRVEMPRTATVERGALAPDLLRVHLPYSVVHEIGGVQQMAMRACDQRWSLHAEQLQLMRRFAAALQEEIAWSGEGKSKAAPLLAPQGGWPTWEELPFHGASDASGAVISGEQLFQQVSPSVQRVEAKLAIGEVQGSAVAVDEHVLLTNCHVVSGATRIHVQSGETLYPATLLKADPASDRCTLEVTDLKLHPIRGIRRFDELKIGEVAYTIGTPQGLEKTLGSGVISGLREEDGRPWVQTSAPISSGSSGGGLFDARGNLVGITTMVRVGQHGSVAQSLNFAIPADRFLRAELPDIRAK